MGENGEEGRGRKSPRGIRCSREKRKEHRGGCNTRDSPREELPGNINLEITQSIPLSLSAFPSLTPLFQNMSKLMNFFLNHEMPQQRTIGSRAGSCQRGVAGGRIYDALSCKSPSSQTTRAHIRVNMQNDKNARYFQHNLA